jgi:DNA-binding HxlR family transcriptional regulator
MFDSFHSDSPVRVGTHPSENAGDDFLDALRLLSRGTTAAVLAALARGADDLAAIRNATGLRVDDAALLSVLRQLTACGATARTVRPGPPLHVEYHVTAAGNELHEILTTTQRWADRWAHELTS